MKRIPLSTAVMNEDIFVRNNVFRSDPIDQEELVKCFDDLALLVDKGFQLALDTYPSLVIEYLVLLMRDVIAGKTYGRSIAIGQQRTKKSNRSYEPHEVAILTSVSLLATAVTPEEKAQAFEQVRSCLIKVVKWEVIELVCNAIRDYYRNTQKFFRLRRVYLALFGVRELHTAYVFGFVLNRIVGLHSKLDTPIALNAGYALIDVEKEIHRLMNRIVTPYLRLTVAVSSQHSSSAAQRADNQQSGVPGLYKAVLRYQPGRSGFAKYARRWIAQQVLQSIKANSNSVAVPNTAWKTWKRINDCKINPSDVSEQELKAAGITEHEFTDAMRKVMLANPLSLDFKYESDEYGEADLTNLIEAPIEGTVLEDFGSDIDPAVLRDAAAKLAGTDQNVRMYLYCNGYPLPHETQNRMQFLHEAVRQCIAAGVFHNGLAFENQD